MALNKGGEGMVAGRAIEGLATKGRCTISDYKIIGYM